MKPVAMKKFAMMMCEGFLNAYIPEMKAKANYSATRKHEPV